MNDRIIELAEQAGAKFIPARTLSGRYGVRSVGEEWDNSNLDTEKFAELLIEDCENATRDLATAEEAFAAIRVRFHR